jgi:hypothetical protein
MAVVGGTAVIVGAVRLVAVMVAAEVVAVEGDSRTAARVSPGAHADASTASASTAAGAARRPFT